MSSDTRIKPFQRKTKPSLNLPTTRISLSNRLPDRFGYVKSNASKSSSYINSTRHWRYFHSPPTNTATTMPPLLNKGNYSEFSSVKDEFEHDPNMEEERSVHPYTTTGMILTALPVGIIIFIIAAGNAMVIAAVLRDSRLKRQVQNWLIISVAAADMFVGLLIMPFTLTYELKDEWILGDILCELWLALDVLFVTASILNLCAISLDRYWSLTNPTTYPQKRTPKRMLLMIMIVWFSAFAISFPPLVGWRPEKRAAKDCFISDQLGYVLYSAFGSFFIPVFVLLFVYARIYCITRRRSKSKPSSKPFFSNGAVGTTTTTRTKKTSTVSLTPGPREILVQHTNGKAGNSDSSNSNDHETNAATLKSGLNGMATSRPSMVPEILFAENDYAVLITKVRSLALMGRNNSIISDNATLDSGMSSPERQQSRLSIVASIANEAVAQSRARALQLQQQPNDRLAEKTFDLKKQLLHRQKLVRRRERQATLVLGLVLGAFIGSWMPFFCSYILSAIGLRTPEVLFDLIFWLGYCNSALNPFIYNFFNPDFRRAFKRILSAPLEKLRMILTGSETLISADRRRSSTASALGGTTGSSSRKTSSILPILRHKKRRDAVFSPRHPYLQVQQQQRQALIVSQFDNMDEGF